MKQVGKIKRHGPMAGFPMPGYNGHTTNSRRCPRCGSRERSLLAPALSGQRIGICHNCGENFVVDALEMPA